MARWNYVCCSTYGKPRSKDFHWGHFKKLLKEIITIDVYGDDREIIRDCLENLEPFIDEVLPEKEVIDLCDLNSCKAKNTMIRPIFS